MKMIFRALIILLVPHLSFGSLHLDGTSQSSISQQTRISAAISDRDTGEVICVHSWDDSIEIEELSAPACDSDLISDLETINPNGYQVAAVPVIVWAIGGAIVTGCTAGVALNALGNKMSRSSERASFYTVFGFLTANQILTAGALAYSEPITASGGLSAYACYTASLVIDVIYEEE